ncbi:MAG: non-canonical purine NTP pyrophosphatase [delta proteobacterium MLS_D]|nr:MAG: non-canonical purine NTP pyrophosphatase [delta proteobacterium MLS_D]
MRRILFASRNEGKIREAQAILGSSNVKLVSIRDFPDMPEVVEDGKNFFENALKKAKTLSEFSGIPTIADDSGLEVDCLDGRPGVHSARYAGTNATDGDNIERLLEEMKGIPQENRKAAFKCVLVLYETDGSYHHFEGLFEGSIAEAPSGTGGFGYDPVFLPAGENKTVAEMDPETKNSISHRGRAFDKLKKYLK